MAVWYKWENPLKTFILVATQPRTQMLQDITSDWGAKHSTTLIYSFSFLPGPVSGDALPYQLVSIHAPSGISLLLISADTQMSTASIVPSSWSSVKSADPFPSRKFLVYTGYSKLTKLFTTLIILFPMLLSLDGLAATPFVSFRVNLTLEASPPPCWRSSIFQTVVLLVLSKQYRDSRRDVL